MKSNNIYKLICFGMLGILLYSCTPEQEVAPIDSPDDNPIATIEPMGDYSSVMEGDTLWYTISLDKMIQHVVDYEVIIDESSTLGADEYEILGGSLSAYSLSSQVGIVIYSDQIVEPEPETLMFTITSKDDIAWNFQLNPDSDVEEANVQEIINVNDPNGLVINFAWEDADGVIDFDMVVENEDLGSWSADGATGDNPEIDASIRNDYEEPYDGTYFVGIDPYDVPEGDINFTVYIGYPDGTDAVFEGVFNLANTDSYPTFEFTAWEAPVYQILTVEKTGNTYDVTFEF